MGFCGQTANVKIARAALHFWEEPPISGSRGSGAVFFSGCCLGCVYCQNRQISREGVGAVITIEELAAHFHSLEEKGAHNLNLVTPTQFAPQIIEAVRIYRQSGGSLPVVYNTGGYERVEAIEALAETVDIYLTDLKYATEEASAKYSGAAVYPKSARAALAAMVRTVGDPRLNREGILLRGVVVRLLVLPSIEFEAMMNLRYLWETYGNRIIVSLMNQYTPIGDQLPEELGAPLPPAAYKTVVDYARQLGFTKAFVQEGETAKESFVPPFSGKIT